MNMRGWDRKRLSDTTKLNGGRPRLRRAVLAPTLAAAAAIGLALTPVLAASNPANDKPQPEMFAFTITHADAGLGSGTVLPDGTLVVASTYSNGDKIEVCRMHPGDRSCASTTTLHPYKSGGNTDTFSGTPEVISTGGKNVSIVVYDGVYIPPFNGEAVIFNSSNDGQSFGKEIKAGDIDGIGAGTFAGGDLVVSNDTAGQLRVQAFSPTVSVPVSTYATPTGKPTYNSALSTYEGGILLASDDTDGNTIVEYAKAGSNFNMNASYKRVADIKGEDLSGLSGNALLTDPGGSLTGGEKLRFFNGSSFGPWHKVPEPVNGDDGYFSLQQIGGAVHIFFLNRRHSYDLYSEYTKNGSSWSGDFIYDSVINLDELVPVLNSIGAGICYEIDGGPVRAQPLMNPQSVSVRLQKSTVTVGTSTEMKGSSSVHLNGRSVTLEQLNGKSWKNFAAGHESANGKFSFKIPGYSHEYRAVVDDDPGYFQYGYSNTVTLTAKKK